MINTPVRVEGVSIIDADGEIVIQSMAQFTQTGNVAVANEIAAALNGPKEGTFEWAMKEVLKTKRATWGDGSYTVFLGLIGLHIKWSLSDDETARPFCPTVAMMKATDWRKAE